MSADTGRRKAVAACLAALALAIAGCGDDSSSAPSAKPASSSTSADRAQIAAVMRDLRERHNRADGKGFCARLTAAGKRELREFAETVPALGTRECEPFMTRLARRVVKSGGTQPPVRVHKIAIDGDRARITMQGGQVGIKAIATYQLAKENGAWKLDDPISGGETRHLPKANGG